MKPPEQTYVHDLGVAMARLAVAYENFGKALTTAFILERIRLNCECVSPGFMRNFKASSYADPVAVANHVYRLLVKGDEEAALRLLEAE
jgi:hypothetical protein